MFRRDISENVNFAAVQTTNEMVVLYFIPSSPCPWYQGRFDSPKQQSKTFVRKNEPRCFFEIEVRLRFSGLNFGIFFPLILALSMKRVSAKKTLLENTDRIHTSYHTCAPLYGIVVQWVIYIGNALAILQLQLILSTRTE